MPKERSSPRKSSPRAQTDPRPNKGSRRNASRPRRQCASRVNYAEHYDDEEKNEPRPRDTGTSPPTDGSSPSVQHAKHDANELAVIAARRVWGPEFEVKIPRRKALKAHATRGSSVPEDVRQSMVEIWRGHDDDWREERGDIEEMEEDDMKRASFSEGTAVIWLAAAGKRSDVKAFCVIEPETEELGRNKREDIVWVLHLTPAEEYDKYNLQAPLLDAVKTYCQQAGIPKNVISAPKRGGGGECTKVWIRLLEQQGFCLSEDTSDESPLDRYERIVSIAKCHHRGH